MVFRAAYEAGDLAGPVRLLHPDAVYVTDGGGEVSAARERKRATKEYAWAGEIDHAERHASTCCVTLMTSRYESPVRPRPPHHRPDRPDPWRRGRRRLDRGTARPRGRRPRRRHRPGLRPGRALALGVDTFIDLRTEKLEDADEADVVFDVIGGDILDRSAALVRAGGTLVTIAMPPKVQPEDGRAVFFVVEPDRARFTDLAQRVREGRLRPPVGAVWPLAEAPAAFAPGKRAPGKTIIRVIED